MTEVLYDLGLGLLVPPAVGWVWALLVAWIDPADPSFVSHALFAWASGAAGMALSGVTMGIPVFTASGIAGIALAAAIWWWRRRKRKRALRELGGKALARLAAMRSALRERAQPRPVLKPAPQGSR